MLPLRSYQKECVDRAKVKNTIVHLPTNSGKTLIAAHVINHFLTKNSEKKIAVLVPNCLLVDQQSKVLRAQCRVSHSPPIVQTLVGEDQAHWNQAEWDKSMKCHIYVGTAEIFRQALATDRCLDVCRFSLIVFDECHNATGNHLMAAVMRGAVTPLYATQSTDAPRILGLTASYVHGAFKNIEKRKKALEALLLSTIFCPTVPARFNDDNFVSVSWKRNKDIKDQKYAVEQQVTKAVSHLGKIKAIDKVERNCSHVFEELGTEALFFYIDRVIVEQIVEKT